ncbi:DUF1513 domain-containing protein [Pseudomonas sp. 5Ae-yellow]|uniref:DUF1513 domain-containing protein n=1 Tax=Pseudomonas sp. 5Ae-yellow TaxID=2759848 RepID=UPI0015F5691B|nr:DUF1513 domain-containing protein [Pseudomonas sp. 5Ae-yellow]MBA6419866.1 DUF1513 domain-containing protein [Pseudomonas sp. 5Ae-yellow]|tara:strand:- start:5580 stop:6695 length:1116 start_codon:yes stop_codon:yes gene_type:complete
MLSRRQVLRAGLASATLLSLSGCAASHLGRRNASLQLLSAVDDDKGQHFITAVSQTGEQAFMVPVSERCHGGCPQPFGDHVVIFARRPGRQMHVINTRSGALQQSIHAGDGYHYYGHGVYSPDARYLYVTMNNYTNAEGLIRVYDAMDGYRAVTDYPLDGIGPHELRLHPDGETLIIALGGIETHPDYDRMKLNIASMRPALLLMDRRNGQITQRFAPSHHQLSCRHLDVSPQGVVIAGYQYEGPDMDTPPLIARLDTNSMRFSELELPYEEVKGLKNYTASIAISPSSPFTVITAPRGHRAIIIDHHSGELVQRVPVPDVAGALPYGEDGFLVSSGLGGLFLLSPESNQAQPHGDYAVHWDNHLTPGVFS